MNHHPEPEKKEQQREQHPGWSGFRSSQNGTSFLRSNLFIFLLGQVATAIVGLCILLTTYGAQQERNLQMAGRIGALQKLTERMDETGTNFSHYGIAADDKRMERLEVRISANEEQTKRIAVMDEKLTRIDKTVDEIRNNTTRK